MYFPSHCIPPIIQDAFCMRIPVIRRHPDNLRKPTGGILTGFRDTIVPATRTFPYIESRGACVSGGDNGLSEASILAKPICAKLLSAASANTRFTVSAVKNHIDMVHRPSSGDIGPGFILPMTLPLMDWLPLPSFARCRSVFRRQTVRRYLYEEE